MTKEELKKEAEEYYEDETEGTFQICEDCYWFADAVQTAYVDSAEPREKRIEELEKENKTVSRKANEAIADKLLITAKYNEVLNDLNQENDKLQKENADLKCECRTCVYTDSPCVRSDYPNKDGVCSHYKNVFDENVELTEQNKHLYNDLTMTEAENAELKEKLEVVIALKNEEMGCIETDFNTFKSKAKEIIKGLLELGSIGDGDYTYVAQAEQFLKESE